MKKLLTYLLFIAVFNSFISAAPACTELSGKSKSFIKMQMEAHEDLLQKEQKNLDIYPLDILSFRFN